jgi:tRNA pseudouridine55 synthase
VALLDVQHVVQTLRGVLELPVPAYSAIKVKGTPLYKRARKGEIFETPIKPMEVRSAELIEYHTEGNKAVLKVVFDVGSGTYIRSLAEEIGRRLNVPATIKSLRRTRIGDFSLEDEHLTLE